MGVTSLPGSAERLRRLLPKRVYLLAAVHVVLFAFSYQLSMWLRYDFNVPPASQDSFLRILPFLVVFKLVLFHYFGSLHGWWRYITFHDLASLLRVSLLATLSIAFVDYFFLNYQIPRSVVLLDFGITILLIGGLRSATRMAREIWWPALTMQGRKPALVIGAEQGGETLARQIHFNPKLDFRIVGFLEEKKSLHGLRLGGIPLLGGPEDAITVAGQYDAKDILVIANSLSGSQMRSLVQRCGEADINVKVIPPVDELVNGSYRLQIRDVDINDLLRREPVNLNSAAVHDLLCGRRVMVTGAGGSIGSEICRQIARCQPAKLLLVERAENSLFLFQRELVQLGHESFCVPCIADIGDRDRMRSLLRDHQVEIVFHAAAHKHVPLMEQNPSEALKNNVLATADLAADCDRAGVERFVMISTDKAVNPTSIMGVSKQLAERFVHALNAKSKTKFVVVRFGNVLASNGSVVPIFKKQIESGGPVTVTHPDMMRYFMTIPEASQLVLQATTMGEGGEIFVLDMGEQIRIVDLARDLIRLSGFTLEDIPIEFVGMRPGEKLYEELYMDVEEMLDTAHPKVNMAFHNAFDAEQITASLAELRSLVGQEDALIRQRLTGLAMNYRRDVAEPVTASSGVQYSPVGSN